MKNFTNNFKQFTSRLSARWLIMALMLLVGTSSAWAEMWINDTNGWNIEIERNGTSSWLGGSDGFSREDKNAYKDYSTSNSTSLTIKNAWVKASSNDGWQIRYVTLYYRVSTNQKGNFTQLKCKDNGHITNASSSYFELSSINKSITDALSSGTYYLDYYFTVGNDGCDKGYSYAPEYNCNGNKPHPATSGAQNCSYYSIKFKVQSSYTVKKSESGTTGGTVKVGSTALNTSGSSIAAGTYDLSITAPTGYKVSAVSVSGGSLSTPGTTGSSTYSGKVNVSAATTVSVTYAKLTYSVTYNANGGDGAPDAQTKTYGTALTLSTTKPTRTGYTFKNWNTKSDGSGTSYASGGSYTVNAAATLYAQWTANQYNITYKDQGDVEFSGTHAAGAPTTHTYGAKTTLKDPTKSGYNFLGWFTKSDCSGTAVASLGATAYSADITLYAKWEKICVPETSITTAEQQQDGTILLAGDFTTCGVKYHGFQWRKSTADWCNDGDESQNFSNYVKIGNTEGGEGEVKYFTPESGVTYVFRTYIYNNGSWIYSSETIEVSTCVSVVEPAVTMSPADGKVCQGSPVELTLTTRQSGVVYTIGEVEIFESTTTYSFIPNTSSVTVTASSTSACAGTNNKTKEFSISIKSLPEAPTFTSNSMTVCAGEPFTLPKPTNLKEDTEDCIWSVGGKTTTGSQPGISETTFYTAVKNDGCSSSAVEFTVNVNPLPNITISGSEKAVFYEDVTLTAEATDAKTINWSITDGTGTLSNTTGTSVKLTSSTAGTVKVKATATSENDCTKESNELSVVFSAENCNSTTTTVQQTVGKTKIIVNNPHNWTTMKCYAWRTTDEKKILGNWSGTAMTKNGNNYEILIDFAQKGISESDKIKVIFNNGSSQTVDSKEVSCNKIYQFSISTSKDGDKYKIESQTASTDSYKEPVEVTVGPEITTPAVKTVSVTSDEDGNVTMVGQVVKTGCDTQAILGLQYKKQNPDGTTYEANYTTYPNPGTKEAISAGKTFTVTTKLEDGTYKVRARIDNSHATNGYGEDIVVVVNTTKTHISNVTLDYCNEEGKDIDDPNPMCKGAIAYVKLSYEGSKYSDIKWLVEGVETNLVTDEGDGVWSYEIQGDGSLSVELKNDANTDPAWPYSNKLPFSIIPVPTAPYISIDPASGVICEGFSATIKVENPSTACSYKLVEEEEDPEAEFVEYESGDLKYSVGSVGKYYVAAKHKLCPTNEYTSNQVAINQIIRTNANISIEPEKTETTPWEPVSITVTADEGYIYEVTYTSNNLANVDGVIIKQNGDTYTYRIPRPTGWGEGNAVSERTPVSYDIKAQLKVDGEANQCDLSFDTATITVKDEEDEDCD